MGRIIPEEIERCFMNRVRAVKKDYEREIIAIDGKTVRGHFKGGGKALHMVSAWAVENRPVFCRVKTEEKSNEITAIPALLEKPALEGSIVTIDAMGCRHKIADRVVQQKADYLFLLKKNRETPYEDVREYFKDPDFSLPHGGRRVSHSVPDDGYDFKAGNGFKGNGFFHGVLLNRLCRYGAICRRGRCRGRWGRRGKGQMLICRENRPPLRNYDHILYRRTPPS
jgi:hypothetical protein